MSTIDNQYPPGWLTHGDLAEAILRSKPSLRPSSGKPSSAERIHSRLNYGPHETTPFPFFAVHTMGPDKHFVFLVHEGKAVVLEDGELFPSDQLITQLRMMGA